MAELKFLKGLLSGLPGAGKSTDNFYVTTGDSNSDYRLYLGDYLLAQGDVVARLVELENAVGEGGSVSTQITNAIANLDVPAVGGEGKIITTVSEQDGIISATAIDATAANIAVADAEEKFDATNVETALAELVTKINTALGNAKLYTDELANGAVKDNTDAIAILNGTAETEGSVAKAVADVKSDLLGGATDDYNTLGKLEDKIQAVETAAKSYSIVEVTSGLGTNVEKAYQLQETVGENSVLVGSLIELQKDDSLVSVALVNGAGEEDTKGQYLQFVYNLSDGTEKKVTIDVTHFLAEAEFANGLEVSEAGVVSVKLDTSSEGFLTVSESGIKLSGVENAVDTALGNAKLYTDALANGAVKDNTDAIDAIEADYLKSADKTELEGKIDAEVSARANADTQIRTDFAAADTTTLNSAKSYTDDEIAKIKGNLEASEAATLEALNDAISAEASARANADTEIRTDFAAADTTTLNSAKDYTDALANGAVKDNTDAIDAIEADYLKSADKTELEGKIDVKVAQSVYDAKVEELESAIDALEDNTITGSTNIVAATEENGNTTLTLQWGTFN